MLFNSYIFILAFLPITCFLYFLFNHYEKYKSAQMLLIGMSLLFYAYYNVWYLGILVGSILINWFISRMIIKTHGRFWLILGSTVNVFSIFVFKYYNFFIDNINHLFKASFPFLGILMPLGISFFTFQQISFLADTYGGETGEYSFMEYTLFVVFFPQLIAGPIVLHQEMIPQFRNKDLKKFNNDRFAKGLYLFAVGLAKKVLLADSFSKGVDWGYSNISSMGSFNTLLVVFCYSFQLYFDFSGYCDMACGIAECFNIELPVNFLSPYKATSIGDFWKRWHITLTRFLTKYIYIPLGGSRRGKTRTLINIAIVFLISGLWHGANWTFVIWGLIHGTAMIAYRVTETIWDSVWKWLRIVATYIFISFAWIPFRAATLSDAVKVFTNIFAKPSIKLQSGFCESFNVFELSYVEQHISVLRNFVRRHSSANMWLMLGMAFFIVFATKNCYEKKFTINIRTAVTTSALLVWSIMSLGGMAVFLYFNF